MSMRLGWGAVLWATLWGCQGGAPATPGAPPPAQAEHSHPAQQVVHGTAAVAEALGAILRPADGQPFRRVGLLLRGPRPALQAQVQVAGGWQPAPVALTWSEGNRHVALVQTPQPATALRLTGAPGLTDAVLEFHPTPLPAVEPVPVQPTPGRAAGAPGGVGVLQQALAPDDLVVTREEWGADTPNRICNDVVAPYRMTVHHTAIPDRDGDDPALTLRQIQRFHIDTRGWCDIGYHFIISQRGLIFEGRRGEDRPAAHVADQNAGNIGFSFIGDYQVQQVPQGQLDAAARIMGWALRTHSGVVPTREFIKGHREWPGQNTQCPGDNLFAQLEPLIAQALGDTPPPQDGEVRFSLAAPDLPPDRDGAGVADALPGEAWQVVATLRNGTDSPLRGVRLGVTVPDGLQVTDYVIESDAPAFDGRSWGVNDADAAPENPPKDGLTGTQALALYAFAAGETKRVVLTVTAGDYGEPVRRALQVWVTEIGDRYAQDAFGAQPTLNVQGDVFAGAIEIDRVHPAAWTWAGPNGREGWDPCGDAPSPYWFREGDGFVSLEGSPGPCLLSPAWTAIDATDLDALAITLRSDAGRQDVRLWWAQAGAAYDTQRSVVFRTAGDGDWQTVQVPVGDAPGWAGLITGLRITATTGFPDGEPASPGWTDVDALWAQSSARREAAAPALAYVDTPAEIIADAGTDDPEPPRPRRDLGVAPDLGGPGGFDGGTPFEPLDGADGGCDVGAAPTPGAGLWWLAVLGLGGLIRRRRGAR